MVQERNNPSSTTQNGSNQEKFKRAQELYEKYYASNNEDYFDQLILVTDSIYCRKIRNLLKQNGCYNDDSEHAAMQEARLAIWERIQKCRKSGEIDTDFSRYCKGIYYHKTMDVVRKHNTYRSHFSDKIGREPVSLDTLLPDGSKSLGDTVEDIKNGPETGISLDEQRRVFNSLFLLYCQSLVNAKAEPPRELALYYARILPHVLHINHEIETIPEEKMASAKWAFERMKDKTIKTLGEISEEEMKKLISHTLSWCKSFWDQLELPVYISTEKTVLKDVVYTSVYNKGKIEDWSESMHKTVVKATFKEAMKDPKLVELATDYISDRDKISCLIKGGRDK